MEGDAEYQVEGDAEQHEEGDAEQLDDYPGGPHDLIVLTTYHVHVAMMEVDEAVRHYIFY